MRLTSLIGLSIFLLLQSISQAASSNLTKKWDQNVGTIFDQIIVTPFKNFIAPSLNTYSTRKSLNFSKNSKPPPKFFFKKGDKRGSRILTEKTEKFKKHKKLVSSHNGSLHPSKLDQYKDKRGGSVSYKITNFAARAVNKMALFGKVRHWRVHERIEKYGYPAETHVVQTEDDYILTLYRIPNGRGQDITLHHRTPQKKIPVLLQHGFLQNSAIWLFQGNKSLPFLLADRGFDVWLGNHRGNIYSTNHVVLDPQKDSAFWDFSVDEMSKYDIPAIIDYILFETGRKTLNYVGYSLGTIKFFAAMSVRPAYNKKVAKMVAMSFTSYFGHSLPNLNKLVKLLPRTFSRPNTIVPNAKVYWGLVPALQCFRQNFTHCSRVCTFIMALSNFGQFNKKTKRTMVRPKIVDYISGGISRRTVFHFLQVVKSDKFSHFDYGKKENMKKYGRPTPPIYDMTKVTVPIFGLYAPADTVLSPLDTKRTILDLPNFVNRDSAEVQNKKWRHNEFWVGIDAQEVAYEPIIQFLEFGITLPNKRV